jgi:glycerophosphoryl diester phosphodiesterase
MISALSALAVSLAVAQPPLVQLGPRPYYLVNDMTDSELKTTLQACSNNVPQMTTFSIGHRGAALQFPEHTKESYEAAARMGAGILECDVTFTQDKQLVCRHAQCDLHTTTNILANPELAAKCTEPFTPAEFDATTGERTKAASAQCCTSDITLAEFKTLCGKMDASDADATTVEAYLGGTPRWRTDLHATCSTVMSHAESIALFQSLGTKMTPELKAPSVEMPFMGDYTQEAYAQQMIDEYKAAGVPPEDVYAQSFSLDDVLYWIANEPDFGNQAVFLDGRYADPTCVFPDPASLSPTMDELVAQGVKIIAPPMCGLLTLDANNQIAPSVYTAAAKAAGLDIITWTLERSQPAQFPGGLGFYYEGTEGAYQKDGDYLMHTLDVLNKGVGILGIFSDWPATVTYYANCMGR